ncbi:hypothetical protein A0J59_09690 [Cellulosimicrobium sp. I38E]|nr:hypothetical protein A0J59_09690 [Cellulosimicrobium sp. I38E]
MLVSDRRRVGALGAATAAVAFGVVYVVAVRTTGGQQADVRALAELQVDSLSLAVAAAWARAALPAVLALGCLGLGLHALLRRRFRDVAAAVLVAVVPLVLSGWLRDVVLTRPDLGDLGYAYNTLPSGHVSAAVGLAAAAVLLCPPRARPAALAFAVVAVVIACAVSVVGHAHRPADTVASVLLVTTVAGVVVAAFDVPSRRTPPARFTRASARTHR